MLFQFDGSSADEESFRVQNELSYAFANVFMYTKFEAVKQLTFDGQFLVCLVHLVKRGGQFPHLRTAMGTGVAIEGLTLLFRTVVKHAKKRRDRGFEQIEGDFFT
jgi:hypothetical protein